MNLTLEEEVGLVAEILGASQRIEIRQALGSLRVQAEDPQWKGYPDRGELFEKINLAEKNGGIPGVKALYLAQDPWSDLAQACIQHILGLIYETPPYTPHLRRTKTELLVGGQPQQE